MVVHCPNCGREIYSDPDYCVMCGWRRGQSQPRGRTMDRGADPRRASPPARRPPERRYEGGYREAPPGASRYPPRTGGGLTDRARTQPPQNQGRYYQQRPREPRQMERRQTERYRDERASAYPPQRRDQRVQYEGRREPQSQRGYERPAPAPRYDQRGREPIRDAQRGGRATGRNHCPNCGREIFGDPNSCALCGWSISQEPRRPRVDAQRRAYPGEGRPGYQGMQSPDRRPQEYREAEYLDERVQRRREEAYPDERGQRYQGRDYGGERGYPREGMRRGPPEDWERRVEERMGVRRPPPQGVEKKTWYQPEEGRGPQKGPTERFACENCGNPSLQFFVDGLGRCPGCGQRFRYSARPPVSRSKMKHKQFICSKCDSKNLQFFLNGTGVCPHCKHEFKWRK